MKILKISFLFLSLISYPAYGMKKAGTDFRFPKVGSFINQNRTEFLRIGITTGVSSAIVLAAHNTTVQKVTKRSIKRTREYISNKAHQINKNIKNLSTPKKLTIGTIILATLTTGYVYFEGPGVYKLKKFIKEARVFFNF